MTLSQGDYPINVFDDIRSGIVRQNSLLTDLSAVANGWITLTTENLSITGITAPTNATVTSTAVFVKGCASITVLYDITGATSGVMVGIRGGISGFAMTTLRNSTAVNGTFGFRLGNATTGATQDTTGISRIDDVAVFLALSANTGANTGPALITMKTRLLLQPSS